MSKPEREFFPITDVNFTTCPGNDPSIRERILARDPDNGVVTFEVRYYTPDGPASR